MQTPSWPHFQPISVLLYKHRGPEVFTGVSDCDRGTIRSASASADLPKERAAYDISVEFSCDGQGGSIQTLWFYGSASPSSAMGLQIDTTQNNFNHYWYGVDMTWSWGDDKLVHSHNICDGAFHTVRVTYEGHYGERKFYFDDVERNLAVSGVGDGTHANRNDNFCLGAEAAPEMGGRGGQPFFGTLKNLQVYGGIRSTETTEEQMIRQVRQAPAVQMCEDDSRCRVGQFRLCVDCPGSDNSNRLTNTIRHIGVGAVFGEPSTADPPPNMEPFVNPFPTENVYQCYQTAWAPDITQRGSNGPSGTGGVDIALGGFDSFPVSTTNTRHPACVPGWHATHPTSPSVQLLAEDLDCEFSMTSGSSTETYRRYAFARESWSVKDATWINRASAPDSCGATSTRPGREQEPISSNPGCSTEGWTWTTDTFDCSQVYNGAFDACFRTSAFRQHSDADGVTGACGPSNWYHDFDTWQCDGCGGQNEGITLSWDTPIPKVNAFKWAQLCETLDAAAACVDRVHVSIVHSGGSTIETISNLQCLSSDDIPNGHNPECTGPFRTRFEERDWKQFNFLSETFTSVTSMTFTLASTSATSANGGHAGVQEIEVGYAARQKNILNSLGSVFWLPEDQAQHYCSEEVGYAAARGVSTDGNPAQCTVTPRAYPHSGLPVSDADQLEFELNPMRPSDTRAYFDSGGAMFGFNREITEDTAPFQISKECWQYVGSPTGFHNIKLTKENGQFYYLPVHMSGPIGPDRYSTVDRDGGIVDGVPGGAILSKNYNRLWGGANIAGTSNVFVEGDVIEFYPAMANRGAGYDCKCIEYYASPPPPSVPPPSIPPQPQLPPHPESPPPPFPPGEGCPRVRFRHLGQVTKTFQKENIDPTREACQAEMHDDGQHTIWNAAQLLTTRLPICGEGLTVAFEFWLNPDPGANGNGNHNPVLTFGDYDSGFFLYGESTSPVHPDYLQPVKDFQIHDNMNKKADGERWVDGMGTFAAGWKKSVLRVQQTGGYTFEVNGTTVMSGDQTFCTNIQKLCILGLNKYGELGGGSMRNIEVYAGGNVNSECFWINHQGVGPRAEWAANQDWAPGVDYLDPHRESDPVVPAAASATTADLFAAESAANYNKYLAAKGAVQAEVASTENVLPGYSFVGTGMCHDEPATSAQYRFRESESKMLGDICRFKCAQLNYGRLTGDRYVNASDHCEAYEVHPTTCHWYAPPAGHHVRVTSLETVGAHTYYGTAANPMRCYAVAAPPPPPNPPKSPTRPPAPPISEDIFATVEELDPFDTSIRYSASPRRIFHDAILTPLDCLLACRADAQCNYAAWLRSDCQASGVGNRCVLGVYDGSTTAMLPKHKCYTEGAFRHFVFNTSRVCDSNYGETGAMTCAETLPYCLGRFVYNVEPSLIQQYVGACFAENTTNPRVPKPLPVVNVVCRNTCLSPTPNNRGEWSYSTSHIDNGVCDDGGLDAKAFGNPAAFACAYGTDCADCGVRPPLPVPLAPIDLCTDTCTATFSSTGTGYEYFYDRDGDNISDAVQCRDSYTDRPRMAWEDHSDRPFTGYCGYGTDCLYCGVRQAQGVVTQAFDVPPPRVESLTDWVPLSYKAPVIRATGSGALRLPGGSAPRQTLASALTAADAKLAPHTHAPHTHAPHTHAPHTHAPHTHATHTHTPGHGHTPPGSY